MGLAGVAMAAEPGAHVVGGGEPRDSMAREVNLSEVAVTGKTKARRMQEQAYAVSVLDLSKGIAATPTMGKVLGRVSSVRIRENGGVGSDYSFSMNGFTGNQVKFFLDGMPMDNFGSSFNLANISANMAQRVEVYKGVLPVYLGADALGGAVNIVTRQTANYLDATLSAGSFNTFRADVNGAYTEPKSGFTLRGNVFASTSKNNYKVWAPIVDAETRKGEGYRWVKRFHDGYTALGARLETGVTRRSWADYLLAGFILSGNHKDVQTGATMDAVYGGVEQRSVSFIPSLRYSKENVLVDGLKIVLNTSYSMVNTYTVDTLATRFNWVGEQAPAVSAGEAYLTDAVVKEREWQANLGVGYVLNDHAAFDLNHVLATMRRSIDDSRHRDDPANNVPQYITKNVTGLAFRLTYPTWNVGVFTKLYWLDTSTRKKLDAFTKKERWEELTAHRKQVGYGVSGTYFVLPYLQVKTSFEQAYRMPEAVELFGDGFIQKANPDLKPEHSRNFNFGVELNKPLGAHRVLAGANFIYRYATDFIMKGVSLTANPTTAYTNLGKVLTKGVEGNVRYEYKQQFYIGGNITYQDIRDRQRTLENTDSYVGEGVTDNITFNQRVPNIPYFFLNAETGYNFRNLGGEGNVLSLKWDLDYVYRYFLSFPGLGAKAGKKIIPEQFAHNVSVGYALDNGKWDVTLECTNLTNKKLYDNYRLQKPGRAWMLKVRMFLK